MDSQEFYSCPTTKLNNITGVFTNTQHWQYWHYCQLGILIICSLLYLYHILLVNVKLNMHTSLDQFISGLFRVSLFINLRSPQDLGTGWLGALGTFMISRHIYKAVIGDWWKLNIWIRMLGVNQLDFSMGISITLGNGLGNSFGKYFG